MRDFTKKFFIPVALIVGLFLSNNVSAQDYYTNSRRWDDKNFRLGLAINPNIGWLRYDNDYDASSKIGFSYGLLADLGFAQNYYFSTGLLINSINSKVKEDGTSTTRNIALKYAEIPLTVKLKTPENDLGRFYGQFGFTAGVKVSGKEKINGEKKTAISGDDIFRLGLQLGGGAEWRIGNNLNVMTGLTYNNGFTRAIKDGKPKTSYFALNLAVFF